MVTVPSLPEVVTFYEQNDDLETRMKLTLSAIEEALAARIADQRDIPPSEEGPHTIGLRLMASLKIALYQALRESGITRAELARRLGWNRESVDRLFRLDHNSRLEQIEAAMKALDMEVDLDVRRVA
ncbi:helix-turn-helix transcriptional regulator [Microvirga sp. 0TCS3.31]